MKKVFGALCVLLMTAGIALSGPIKGLVDIGTGMEVPDADARYYKTGETNASGAFADLTVETNASNGTEVVNWQTLTNFIAGGGTTWGTIGGTLSNQTDLWSELTNRYTKAESDALGVALSNALTVAYTAADTIVSNALDAKIDLKVDITGGVSTNLAMDGSTESVDATNGLMVVNWQTMTNYVVGTALSDVAFKSQYNVFTTSNRFDGDLILGTAGKIGFTGLSGSISEAGQIVFAWSDGSRQIYNGVGEMALNVPSSGAPFLADAASTDMWQVQGTATNGNEIVNWQTMTNYIYAGATEMTNVVSFPNGIIVAGQLIDGTTNLITVAQISDFADGVTNVIEAGSFLMGAGTTWAFALASVTNDATSGTEIVNWQTMASYIAAADIVLSNALTVAYTAADVTLSNQLTVAYQNADTALSNALTVAYTAADTVVSNALTTYVDGSFAEVFVSGRGAFVAAGTTITETNATTVANFDITRGRLYVAEGTTPPIDADAYFSIYRTNDYHGANAVYRSRVNFYLVECSGATGADTTFDVDDASGLAANDLIWITDGTDSEFGRIVSVSVNTVVLEDSLSQSYVDDSDVMKVIEYGSVAMASTDDLYWRVVFDASQTLSVTNWVEYKR